MKSEIVKYTATQLRKLRAEKDITLTKLSEITKIDVGALVRYEKGSTAIRLDRLAILLDYYEITFQTFFNLD